ncbi:PD-(D/E)XK motif protein [Aurantimicrobium sp. MWH-Uga1]|uniref:PD-(D/E)XK motif protein n=1 Tax=Aurantimicrobium sp. MWH-Uga1 TaxID=2079575 RepID=UPI000DEDA96F|nr:PD-(D/E)XK motif protein [Aurantimicrobium sp. MWH-Uga1]AXE53943.1 hypothetical protein AURUGA1_00231 [Aurantimicrobium sp. MWH-Uga1]
MSSKERFQFLASVLEANNQYLTSNSGLVVGNRHIRFAVSPDGFPALVVPIVLSREGKINLGLRAIRADVFNGNSPELEEGSFFRLELQDHNLLQEFSYLVDDVLDSLGTSNDLPQINRIIDVVESWKKLFSEVLAEKIDNNKLTGVYGELLFLEALVTELGPGAIEIWQGYKSERHDFVSNDASIEVKTSLSREGFWVTIHGLHQLEGDKLGILGIKLERSPRGRSFSELVDSISKLGVSSSEIEKCLQKMGINSIESDKLTAQKYIVFDSKFCFVDDFFPKIVPSSLKNPSTGELIQNLSYQVNLAALKGKLGEESFREGCSLLRGQIEA